MLCSVLRVLVHVCVVVQCLPLSGASAVLLELLPDQEMQLRQSRRCARYVVPSLCCALRSRPHLTCGCLYLSTCALPFAGSSNHGQGIALDLNTDCGKQFGAKPPAACKSSAVYMWLLKNARTHGFIRAVVSHSTPSTTRHSPLFLTLSPPHLCVCLLMCSPLSLGTGSTTRVWLLRRTSSSKQLQRPAICVCRTRFRHEKKKSSLFLCFVIGNSIFGSVCVFARQHRFRHGSTWQRGRRPWL
jgi:hypothetical protein